MRDWFSRLFSPGMGPSYDERQLEQAARASERRIVLDEIARAARMAEYAKNWPGQPAAKPDTTHVVRFDAWTKEATR